MTLQRVDTFICTIPFQGFYDSIHSSEVDHALEMELTDRDSGCTPAPDFIQEAAWQALDYSAIYQDYAKCYAESFLQWLGLDGTFESMDSPREYNFSTDRIFVTLTRGDVARLWRMVSREDFTKACKERFTSYDGFISGYSSDWKTWGALSTWDHNQIGTLVGVAAVYEYASDTCADSWDSWAEHSLIEDLSCNGDLHNWLYEHGGKEFARAVNAWDYLQERGKRAIKTMEQWHNARRAENRPFESTPLGAYSA